MPGQLVQDVKGNSESSIPFAQKKTVCCEVQASSFMFSNGSLALTKATLGMIAGTYTVITCQQNFETAILIDILVNYTVTILYMF